MKNINKEKASGKRIKERFILFQKLGGTIEKWSKRKKQTNVALNKALQYFY